MRTIAKVILVGIVFTVTAALAEKLAGLIPGTPTKGLNALMSGTNTAGRLAASLGSREGCRLLSVHSEWIIFVYLPIASVTSSLASRLSRTNKWLTIGVVCALVASRIGLMIATSRALPDLAAICGLPGPRGGVSLVHTVLAFALCAVIACSVALVGRRAPIARDP